MRQEKTMATIVVRRCRYAWELWQAQHTDIYLNQGRFGCLLAHLILFLITCMHSHLTGGLGPGAPLVAMNTHSAKSLSALSGSPGHPRAEQCYGGQGK